jgi:hypothetical protein
VAFLAFDGNNEPNATGVVLKFRTVKGFHGAEFRKIWGGWFSQMSESGFTGLKDLAGILILVVFLYFNVCKQP